MGTNERQTVSLQEAESLLLLLGAEFRREGRGGYAYRAHLVTDLHDDGQTACGYLVSDVTQQAVRVVGQPAPRSWMTHICGACLMTATNETRSRWTINR